MVADEWIPLDGHPMLGKRALKLEEHLLFGDDSGDWISDDSEISGYLGNEGATKRKQYTAAILAFWLEDSDPDALADSMVLNRYASYVIGLVKSSSKDFEPAEKNLWSKLNATSALSWQEFLTLSELALRTKSEPLVAAMIQKTLPDLVKVYLSKSPSFDVILRSLVLLMKTFPNQADAFSKIIRIEPFVEMNAFLALSNIARYLYANLRGHSLFPKIINFFVENIDRIVSHQRGSHSYSARSSFVEIFETVLTLGGEKAAESILKAKCVDEGLISNLRSINGFRSHPLHRQQIVKQIESLTAELSRLETSKPTWATIGLPDSITDQRVIAFIRSNESSIILNDIGGVVVARKIGKILSKWNSAVQSDANGSGKNAVLNIIKGTQPTIPPRIAYEKTDLERKRKSLKEDLKNLNRETGVALSINLRPYEVKSVGEESVTWKLSLESDEDEKEKEEDDDDEEEKKVAMKRTVIDIEDDFGDPMDEDEEDVDEDEDEDVNVEQHGGADGKEAAANNEDDDIDEFDFDLEREAKRQRRF